MIQLASDTQYEILYKYKISLKTGLHQEAWLLAFVWSTCSFTLFALITALDVQDPTMQQTFHYPA